MLRRFEPFAWQATAALGVLGILALGVGCTKSPSSGEAGSLVAAAGPDVGERPASEDTSNNEPADEQPKNNQNNQPADNGEASNQNGSAENVEAKSADPDEDATDATDEEKQFVEQVSEKLGKNLAAWEQGKQSDFKPLVTLVGNRLASNPGVMEVQVAAQVAQVLDAVGSTAEAKPLYEGLEKAAEKLNLDNQRLAEFAQETAKTGLARLNLIGTKPTIEGTTFDGDKFDWSKYQGKVVLIDFWATWCGPCIQELPNVKRVYEKLHEKGFDIVGISMDVDEEDLADFLEKDKLPWMTLFPANPEQRGPNLALAKEFHVEGIPATYLIGRDGKIASISARGKQLEPQVQALLEK